jgi:hypothetical protein
VGGGAWPFLVGGAICLVNSDNERDSVLLTRRVIPVGRARPAPAVSAAGVRVASSGRPGIPERVRPSSPAVVARRRAIRVPASRSRAAASSVRSSGRAAARSSRAGVGLRGEACGARGRRRRITIRY